MQATHGANVFSARFLSKHLAVDVSIQTLYLISRNICIAKSRIGCVICALDSQVSLPYHAHRFTFV